MYNMNITELKLGSTMGYQGGLLPIFLGYADRHFIVNDKYGAIAYFCYLFGIPGHSQASWRVLPESMQKYSLGM